MRIAGGIGLLAATLVATGCSTPQFASMSPNLRTKQVAVTKPLSPASSPTAQAEALVPMRGDLAAGSHTSKISAGTRTVVIDYWVDRDPKTWTADSATVLRLSAHIEDGDIFHAVKVSRFFATLDDGSSTSTLSDDRGDFVITPPFSYGTALTIRPADPNAASATVTVQLDLLVETIPMSGQFFRQTVLDTVNLQFAQKVAQ